MQPIRESEVITLLSDCIYKFGPLTYLPRTLSDCTIGFSSLRDFNDIHEYEYRIVHYFDSIEAEKNFSTSPKIPSKKSKVRLTNI